MTLLSLFCHLGKNFKVSMEDDIQPYTAGIWRVFCLSFYIQPAWKHVRLCVQCNPLHDIVVHELWLGGLKKLFKRASSILKNCFTFAKYIFTKCTERTLTCLCYLRRLVAQFKKTYLLTLDHLHWSRDPRSDKISYLKEKIFFHMMAKAWRDIKTT